MTHNYHKYEGESDQQLIFRVCQDKDKIGTWNDVADILNDLLGEKYGESRYRKAYQSATKMLVANEEKFIDSKNALEEINLARRELEKERKKLQSAKIEYNRWLRENARDEMVTEQIVDAVNALEPPKVKPLVIHSDRNKEGILVLSDAHYSVEYKIEGLFGEIINEYSPEIFEERMSIIFTKTLEIIKKENFDTIHIFELGDNVDGILRLTSQLMKLRYGVIDSAINYANYFAEWLNELSQYVKLKVHFIKDSNHNQLRLCGAPKNSFTEENMSKVILTILEEKLKNNNRVVFIKNPTGFAFDNICGYNIMGIHGEVKSLKTAINDFSRMYGVNIQYLLGGHKHHKGNEEIGIDCEVISVGSIIGVDTYSMSLSKTANPTATFLVFQEGLGKTIEYTIKLN